MKKQDEFKLPPISTNKKTTAKEILPSLPNYKKAYSELLKSPKWQKKRLEILNRDSFTCKKCGDTETTLHIHHIEYHKGKKPWEYENQHLDTLCSECHKHIEYISKEIGRQFFDYHSIIKVFKTTFLDDTIMINVGNYGIDITEYPKDDLFESTTKMYFREVCDTIKLAINSIPDNG